jgi:hypothetical protein
MKSIMKPTERTDVSEIFGAKEDGGATIAEWCETGVIQLMTAFNNDRKKGTARVHIKCIVGLAHPCGGLTRFGEIRFYGKMQNVTYAAHRMPPSGNSTPS